MAFLPTYIKEEYKENIINYKFQSNDASLLYNYITSPLCNYLVTLCGLFCVIIINVLVNIFGGLDGKGDIPSWVSILSGVLYFTYHIFDLLDGKHARNTKNSSPLGLLMDHGCDALTTFLFLMSLATILKIYDPLSLCVCWYIGSITFFFCTLEEFHLDRLDFPPINGVNEGALLASLLCIFTGIVGQEFWLKSITIFNIQTVLNIVVLYTFFGFSMCFSLFSIIKICINPQTKILEFIINMFMFVDLIISQLLLIEYAKESYSNQYPKLIIYMYGFLFAKLMVKKLII